MIAYEVLGGAWIDAQELAIAPIALHLLPVGLVGGESKHNRLPEDGDGLQALVTSNILITRPAVGLDSISTYHFSCP